MEIITTYGDTVFNDGTIKKQMVYQFTDTNTMVSMWNERDTSTDIEWTMSLDKLTITCVDYVVFGTDVGVVQIDEVSSTGNKMIDRAWIRGRINKLLRLHKKHVLIKDKNISLEEIQRNCAQFLLKYEWVKNTYTATQLHENEYSNSFHSLVQRGFNQKRSGDIIVSLQTGWLSSYWSSGGTTHGSSYSYDTHVPLIFWGGNIPQGKTDRKVNIRDIAPTISTILGTAYPNGCTGNPLPEVTE